MFSRRAALGWALVYTITLVMLLLEALVVQAFLDAIGFETERVLFEAQSRNTRENATFTRDLVAPQPGQFWLLVTSAVHMPRSVGTFRAAGWQVLPYPVDTSPPAKAADCTSTWAAA